MRLTSPAAGRITSTSASAKTTSAQESPASPPAPTKVPNHSSSSASRIDSIWSAPWWTKRS